MLPGDGRDIQVGSSITVVGNLFTANTRGIVVENGMPTIVENEFTRNHGAAIQVTDASPMITKNNLYANVFNVEVAGSEPGVSAEGNWWGSSDAATIDQSIWDGKDAPVIMGPMPSNRLTWMSQRTRRTRGSVRAVLCTESELGSDLGSRVGQPALATHAVTC